MPPPPSPDPMIRTTWMRIDGLQGHADWKAVYEALHRTPGVTDVHLSLSRGLAVIRHRARCTPDALRRAVRAPHRRGAVLATRRRRPSENGPVWFSNVGCGDGDGDP